MPFGANQKFNGFVPFKLIDVIKHSVVELTATFEIYNLLSGPSSIHKGKFNKFKSLVV